MTRRSFTDLLADAVPPCPSSISRPREVPDLERILALPRRPPFNCEPDPVTGRYTPETQALIELETARFTRGPRVSCACRPRRVRALGGGNVAIFRVLPRQFRPEPPVMTTVERLALDCRTSQVEAATADRVASLRPGEELEILAATHAVDGAAGHPCVLELNGIQSWILHEAALAGGILGFLGVGSGKTYAGLLVPLVFPFPGNGEVAVLLCDPSQRRHYHSFYLRLREHFRVTSIRSDDQTYGYTVPGTWPLHLIPYSKISRDSTHLERLNPTLVIGDEGHNLAGESARTRRALRFFAARIHANEKLRAEGKPARNRATHFLTWSGTAERDSVRDTHNLSAYALGTGSPIPIHPDAVAAWAAVIDPIREPDLKSRASKGLQRAFGGGEVDVESLDDLFDGGAALVARIRDGIGKRRRETLGVITAAASQVIASLYITERKIKVIPEAVRQALKGVREDWLRPDGDEIVEKVRQVECAQHVGCGFFEYWAFPKHPCSCRVEQKRVDDRDTWCDQCRLIDDWYAKRKKYNCEKRSKILRAQPHLDSSELCDNAAARFWQSPLYEGDLPMWDSETWPAWHAIEDKVSYDKRVRWIDEFLAQDAATWAKEHRGVVWCQSTPLGHKIAKLAGLVYHGGGPDAEARILAESGEHSIIASVWAHGTGRDGLQNKFDEQLVVEWPGSNARVEQLLGRLHRRGQTSAVVRTEGYFHTREFKQALENCLVDAQFNEPMTNRQKILLADIDIDWVERP